MTYQVTAGIDAFAVRGDWFDMRLEPIKTGKLNIFTPVDVIVNPDPGGKGRHGPSCQTNGGNYARLGYYAFRGANGQVLVVHKQHVQKIEGSKNGGATTEAKA